MTTASNGTVLKEIAYTYDAYDRRIAKVVDADGEGAEASTEERFVYDGDHIALVFDGEGNQTHRYLHGPQVDQVLAEETADGESRWALTDHQGTVRDVIDNNGTVLNHTTYDSFGQVTSETNPDINFRFGYTGRELDDETGLMYYRARYFDPVVGSFVSEDPLGFDAGDTNIYRYVFNSPTNYTDPSGMIVPILAPLVPIAIGAGAGVSFDLGVQLALNGGDLSQVRWGDVAISGAAGALGGGVGSFASSATKTLGMQGLRAAGTRVGINMLGSAAVGAYTRVARNAWYDRCLSDGVLLDAGLGALFGGGASIIEEGLSSGLMGLTRFRGRHLTSRADNRLPYLGLDVPESFPRSPSSNFYPSSNNITPRYNPPLLPLAQVVGPTISNSGPALNLSSPEE